MTQPGAPCDFGDTTASIDEEGFLNAFDSNRDLIWAAAAKVYLRGSKGSYDLVAADF